MESEKRSLTVYFDGGCSLCRAEIDHYRKQEGADDISFRDVSISDEMLAGDLTKEQAMKRFHVRVNDGSLLSGAAAFVAVWSALPRWKWAARLAAMPGILTILEIAYRLFLPVRPIFSSLLGRFNGRGSQRSDLAGNAPDADSNATLQSKVREK